MIYTGGLAEGGIDLTALNLEGCFSSFMAETRSSPEPGAQLKDFPSAASSRAAPPSPPMPRMTSSRSVARSATPPPSTSPVAGRHRPASWTSMSADQRKTSPAAMPPARAAGHINLSTAVVSGTDYTVTSDTVTPLSAGDYCFYAEYPAGQDTNYPDGAFLTDFSDECFTVTPDSPPSSPWRPGPAVSRSAPRLMTRRPWPTRPTSPTEIPRAARSPSRPTVRSALNVCTGTAVYTSVVAVSGDGDYTASDGDANGNDIPGEPADEFIPTAAGTYNWIAVYSGDPPNTLGVSGSCADENEGSVVNPNQPTIVTEATGSSGVPLGTAIDDTATLANTADQPDGDPAGGTITFTAYGPFGA